MFPEIQCGKDGYYSHNFSKWWGRYSKQVAFKAAKTAFHSFRHNFTDALRAAGAGEDVSRALVGHAQGGVHGRYGAKDMAARFRHRLAEAVASVTYAGLDLSHLMSGRTTQAEARVKRRT